MLTEGIWPWIWFNLVVLALLALDLGVFHRKAHKVSIKEAAIWSVVWIALSLAFNLGIYLVNGPAPAVEFFTGYVIEKSLSVDNIFVFVLIFSYFSVPDKYQHRVLFWGIIGALLMRGTLIFVGAALLESFHWIIYIFGAFLIITGIRMGMHRETEIHPEKNPVLKLMKKMIPFADNYAGNKFFIRDAGRLVATPLFLVLIVIETTDLIFAVDSIPAIFAVTTDPFIVYTSNVCAILGLRSLYFVLAGVIDRFYYLKIGLAIVLTFVGIKMVLGADLYHIPTWISLLVIAVILTISIVASLIKTRKQPGHEVRPIEQPQEEEGFARKP